MKRLVQKVIAFIKKLIYKENASGEDLICYLRKRGAKIGENVSIYAANKTLIDKSAPWLLTIGDRVRIAEGVKILTHDYAWSVLKCSSTTKIKPGQIIGAQSPVEIGNNVFVGMNTIITRGVKIGDNVIIGAGSIVTKNCQANSVYAGNPAKHIMSLDAFYEKRKKLQFAEAKEIALLYRERFGEKPPMEVFGEYCMLFADADLAISVDEFLAQMKTSGNYEDCEQYLKENKPMFPNFESFLNACYAKESEDRVGL